VLRLGPSHGLCVILRGGKLLVSLPSVVFGTTDGTSTVGPCGIMAIIPWEIKPGTLCIVVMMRPFQPGTWQPASVLRQRTRAGGCGTYAWQCSVAILSRDMLADCGGVSFADLISVNSLHG